jgi:YycE-like protein
MGMQIRVARPTSDLRAAVMFYRDLVQLPVLAEFHDHDGFSGVILGVPDESRQLELVWHEGTVPSPTTEDQLVLYLGSAAAVAAVAERLEAGGVSPRPPANPYWSADGARCFVDPDGYWLVLSPSSWEPTRSSTA